MGVHEKRQQRNQWERERSQSAEEELLLHQRYAEERAVSLRAYLASDEVATFAATPTRRRQAGPRFLVTDAALRRGSHPTSVGSRRGSRTMRPSASRPRNGSMPRQGAGDMPIHEARRLVSFSA
jgi:hypothetical protein